MLSVGALLVCYLGMRSPLRPKSPKPVARSVRAGLSLFGHRPHLAPVDDFHAAVLHGGHELGIGEHPAIVVADDRAGSDALQLLVVVAAVDNQVPHAGGGLG